MPDWGILAIALLAGALIGCIGIGGVLLVPALVYLAGTPIHAAIAAAMFSYLFSGAAATWVFARKGSIDWDSSAWLALGAVPGSFAGALAAGFVPSYILEAIVAVMVLLAGLRALQPGGDTCHSAVPARSVLIALGMSVGFGSAITGTGGPLLLVPLLVWLRVPILATIGLSQAIQLPIAALATAGNLLSGQLDLRLGVALGVALTAGSLAGARLAHVVPTIVLTRFVGALMLAVGAMIIARLAGMLV